MVSLKTVIGWDAFSAYLFWDKKMSRSSSSVCALKSRFLTLEKYFSDKEFTRENFTIFIMEQEKKGAKPSNLNKYLSMAKHIGEYLKNDCLRDFSYFREKVLEVIPLTAEEVEKMSTVHLQYKKMKKELNLRDYVLIQFMFATASRIGEAQNLVWDDVRNAPVPHVIFRDTKNGEDHTIRLTKRVLDLLQTLPRGTERVFTSYRGDPISIPETNIMIKKRAEKIGLKKHVHTHIFRHSMGYYLGSIGFDEALIAKFLNHKDINTTKRYTQRDLEQLTPLAYANPLENPAKSIGELSDGARKLLEKFYGRAFNIIQENVGNGIVNFRIDLIKKS